MIRRSGQARVVGGLRCWGAVLTAALGLLAGRGAAAQAIGAVSNGSPLAAPVQGAAFDDLVLRTGLFARDRNISVLERPKPGYESLTLPVGPFLAVPSLAGGVGYTSNVYAATAGAQDDEVFRVTPSFIARDDYRRGVIDVFGGLSADVFPDHSHEGTLDGWAGANARLEVLRDSMLQFGASFARRTEDRATLQTPANNRDPIRFDESRAFVGGLQAGAHWRFSEQLSVRDIGYDDSVDFNGAPLAQGYRDRTIVLLTGRAEYALTPAVSAFADATANTRRFRNQGDGPLVTLEGSAPSELKRSSSGGVAEAGANFDVGGLARGEVAIGYAEQDFESPLLRNVSGFSGRGRIEYFPTPLVTVTVTGERTIEDSTIVASGGYFASTVSGRADYELLRPLIVSAGVAYENDDYRQIDRTDDRTVVTAGGRYLMNRAVRLNVDYQHVDQTSSGLFRARDFTVDRIFAGLSYQF